jgi:hypothetical protein
MRERMVVCGGLQAPRGSPTDMLKLDVNASAGSPRKVNLHLGDLSRPMADNIPDVLTDMLEIAAYVYCADQFTKRGTELMTNMGADWRRKFRFRIPVRCPDVWRKDSVREALVETLGFLSEDELGKTERPSALLRARYHQQGSGGGGYIYPTFSLSLIRHPWSHRRADVPQE